MARPMKIFMRGKKVTMLQELLRRMGYPMHDKPGQFGTSTRDAVKAVQSQYTLRPTGIVDDGLLQLMQQGQPAPEITEKAVAKAPSPDNDHPQQSVTRLEAQTEALVRLLIRKGVFTENELHDEMVRIQPKQITEQPLI